LAGSVLFIEVEDHGPGITIRITLGQDLIQRGVREAYVSEDQSGGNHASQTGDNQGD
jgi:hypothetical protein